MDKSKLKISSKDWLYIIIIATFFGLLISFVFYFLKSDLRVISTITFSTLSSVLISLCSFIFISISNEYFLPNIAEKFWYFISFVLSFLSGFLGFSLSFFIFKDSSFPIIEYISFYWFYISLIIGLLTLLVGLILHQFISMKYKSESYYKEILETKIKALENELNPHFLFNALNSISELIYIDKQKAEKATLDLSTFLRNAINKESLVSINSELHMVKTYLEIEKIRFDDNIKLHISNDLDNDFIMIPKFSIQLLVENAIKHGYHKEVLNIDITIKKDEIIVANNGRLVDNIVFGTGLTNLDRRLNLLNVGSLAYKKEDEKMKFFIKLKRK